jgi:hypothetical protein
VSQKINKFDINNKPLVTDTDDLISQYLNLIYYSVCNYLIDKDMDTVRSIKKDGRVGLQTFCSSGLCKKAYYIHLGSLTIFIRDSYFLNTLTQSLECWEYARPKYYYIVNNDVEILRYVSNLLAYAEIDNKELYTCFEKELTTVLTCENIWVGNEKP